MWTSGLTACRLKCLLPFLGSGTFFARSNYCFGVQALQDKTVIRRVCTPPLCPIRVGKQRSYSAGGVWVQWLVTITILSYVTHVKVARGSTAQAARPLRTVATPIDDGLLMISH